MSGSEERKGEGGGRREGGRVANEGQKGTRGELPGEREEGEEEEQKGKPQKMPCLYKVVAWRGRQIGVVSS